MHDECQNIFIAEVVSLILLDKLTMKHKCMHTRKRFFQFSFANINQGQAYRDDSFDIFIRKQ